MKIFIEANDREVTKVEVDYDKTKPATSILAEYSTALVIAQSERIEDLMDELGIDEKRKEGLMEAQHLSNKFIFDAICEAKVKNNEPSNHKNTSNHKNNDSLISILGLLALSKALKEGK